MKETLDKLRMHSFYGRLNIEEMKKELPEAPTVPELLETIMHQQETIMLYQEALEAMTKERNMYEELTFLGLNSITKIREAVYNALLFRKS